MVIGVCTQFLFFREVADSSMQSLASELNISDTAYIGYVENRKKSFINDDVFTIRWFTLAGELELCGHATLASAAVIFFECGNANDEITFRSTSGDLRARKQEDGITLDFPKNEPKHVEAHTWERLLRATVGEAFSDVERILIAPISKDMLVVLNDKHSCNNLQFVSPDMERMIAEHDGSIVRGVIVTTKAKSHYDFLSRYFAPWDGILEDPVTGSAHTVLGPYWSNVLGKKDLLARQCSKRGGDIKVVVGSERVFLTGSTVTVIRGTVNLPKR